MNLKVGTPNPEPSKNGNKIAKDRPLSDLELEAQRKAIKLSTKDYPPILPFPGTIGFLIRNIRGGNETVFQYIDIAYHIKSGNNASMRDFIVLWNSLDEFSKKRVDVFDIMCKKLRIAQRRLCGIITEGMFEYGQQETMIDIMEAKPKLIATIDKFTTDRRNHQDRALMAKVTKLTEETPLVSLNQTTNIQKNTLIVEASEVGFSDIIRNSEKVINAKSKKPLELEEGNKEDFINTEFQTLDREKEHVNVNVRS